MANRVQAKMKEHSPKISKLMTYGGSVVFEEALPDGKVFLEALERPSLEVVKTASGKASIVNVVYRIHCSQSSTLKEIAEAIISELIGSEVHRKETKLESVSFILRGVETNKFTDSLALYNVIDNDHIHLVCKEETLTAAKPACCTIC